MTLYVPSEVDAPAEIVRAEDPLPVAEIEAGAKLAVAPPGRPDTDKAIEALKAPVRVDVMVAVPVPACAIDSDWEEVDNEKKGPNLMSIIGCSSIPFGATPCCPSR